MRSTPHINPTAPIAPTILLPGDPLRAKFIAETYLEDAQQFNAVRNMLGYTGTYRGTPVSVMGSGMGIPSISLYAHELITAEIMDNGLAYNEDLVANWQIFSAADGCAYVDFAGYHYRQHAASASHRALPPESIDQQRQAAVFIREHASPAIQQSANAFYYEKLVYLASMILRRDDAAAYRVQINELGVGIRAGLQDPNLGRNPRLPLAIRAAAWATINCPVLWRKVCRTMLKDRR